MNKDEALKQAKITFIQKTNSENILPYYWANIIIVGNTAPVKLSVTHLYYWLWGIAGIIAFLLLALFFKSKKAVPASFL